MTGKSPSPTIPRLELLGTILGMRALNFVTKELHLPDCPRFLWCDSKCVLLWLTTSHPLAVFVDNRRRELRQTTDVTYKYVPSADNPADHLTRGLTSEELQDTPLWWHGPQWLSTDQSTWPSKVTTTPEDIATAETEMKSEPLFHTAVAVSSDTSNADELMTIDSRRFSSLTSLLRVTAICLKFIKSITQRRTLQPQSSVLEHVFKNMSPTLPIRSCDLQKASLLWTHRVQRASYPDAITALQDDQPNTLVSQLNLRLDTFGVLRCHGRLSNAGLPDAAAVPKLLPRRAHLTHLAILHAHGRLIHAGISHTLAHIRQEFWIPQGRAEVRFVLRRCPICRRHEGNPFRLPAMPPWPKERVTRSSPFEYSGVDYLGPVYVKRQAYNDSSVSTSVTSGKCWIALFTCLATRAVHLECVPGLSGQLFLNCLRRFVARRGSPRQMISDNAPQFKMVKTVLDKLLHKAITDNDVHTYLASHGIQWRFTTELAPWQGGFYERLVSLVKRAFRKGLGRRVLSPDELLTFLCEVESMINTRPLTYVGDDLDAQVLSPSTFITGRHNLALPCKDTADDLDYHLPGTLTTTAEDLRTSWMSQQRHLDEMWNIWKSEYLLSLRERPQRPLSSSASVPRVPNVGEIVLISDPDQPRGSWPLAKIIHLTPSQDGSIRSVTLRTATRQEMHRPISKIYPLELSTASTDNQPDPSTSVPPTPERPRRSAASEAFARIVDQNLNHTAFSLSFDFP